jgi:CubicO group peptidase (beta-lactamase class C family)
VRQDLNTDLLPKARQGITIEQLATHHSGLAHKPTVPVCNTAELYATVMTIRVNDTRRDGCANGGDPFSEGEIERQKGCTHRYLCFPPNDRFSYSNWGYDLLGPLLAFNAGYGDDFNRLAYEKLFAPLGMTHTFSTELIPLGGIERAPSWNCENGPCTSKTVGPDPTTFTHHGSGNLWSTGDDMLRYLRYAMGKMRLPVDASALNDARSLIFCDRGEGTKGEDDTVGQIGLAWNHEIIGQKYDPSHPGDLIWEKSGSAGDFHAYIAFSLERGAGVFVLGNTSEDKPSKIARSILGKY